ncbi:MAG: hypothetical protein ACLPWS_21755 [Rhodomicrobium sp.]
MMKDVVRAIEAWLGKASVNEDGAGLTIWILRHRASERSQKSGTEARERKRSALAAA